MPYNSNEQLEREARESLVAADLSAKMKQWRDQKPPPKRGGNNALSIGILLALLVLGGVAWLFWPSSQKKTPVSIEQQPSELQASDQQPLDKPAPSPRQESLAQRPVPSANRYLALAQSNYRAPDFSSEIRGADGGSGQDLLNDARRALAAHQYSAALSALQNVPTEYKTDADYLRGHALFGLKKYPQAATVFNQLTGSIRYGEAAQWYEALSLLPDMEQNKSLFLKKLKKMADDEGHTFQKEAADLYRAL